jgi:MoaA/NifB/PqqE/SkfB family radical SAM enzyme
LLDRRLPEFIEHARGELPSAFILINTNGDLLDLPLWNTLRTAGLDYANITQHDGTIGSNIQEILASVDPDEKKHLWVHTSVEMNNRAGLVASGTGAALPLKKSCSRPFYQLCVNYRGKAVLCCNDYLGLVEVGDLHRDTISAIWESKFLKRYRRKLFRGDRAHLKLCSTCDVAQGLFDPPLYTKWLWITREDFKRAIAVVSTT